MSNVKKVTKAQRNEDIMAMLTGNEVKYGTTVEDAIAHLTKENEMLAKKNKPTGDKRLTKDQQRSKDLQTEVLEYLQKRPTLTVTVTDIMTLLNTRHPEQTWSNQRAAFILNALSDKYDKEGNLIDDSGKLGKTLAKGKNKATFQIKPEYVMIEEDEIEEE